MPNFNSADLATGRDPNEIEAVLRQLIDRIEALEGVGTAWVPTSSLGEPDGVATLDEDGKLVSGQIPAGLETVTGSQAKANAAAAASIPLTQKGAASGVATLGGDGKLTPAQAPAGATYTNPNRQPTDLGLLAWTDDPRRATLGGGPGTKQALFLMRLRLPAAASVTSIVVDLAGASTNLTAGNNYAALYTAAGVLVGQTADQTAAWQGYAGTPIVMPLVGGPYDLTAADYYAGFWWNGTGTAPSFSRMPTYSGHAMVNFGLTSGFWSAYLPNVTLTNAAPASFNPASLEANSADFFIALK